MNKRFLAQQTQAMPSATDPSHVVHATTAAPPSTATTQHLPYYGLSLKLILYTIIIALTSFHYGFGVSVINSPAPTIYKKCFKMVKDPVTNITGPVPMKFDTFFPPCVAMSDTEWSFVVAGLPAGALFGALLGGVLAHLLGRKLALWLNNFVFVTGTGMFL